MKTVQIKAVKRIAQGDTNVIILELANGKPSVLRSPEQFLNDLSGSFLIDEGISSMNHPQVRKCLRNLRGGMLEGDLKYAKAGETWIVTKDSQVITNPKAKGFGQYAIGDEKEYEKDATIVVDGFLTLDLKEDAYQREDNAQAYATARVGRADAFDIAPDVDGGTSPITDESVINDAEGNEEEGDETPNQVKKETATEAAGA